MPPQSLSRGQDSGPRKGAEPLKVPGFARFWSAGTASFFGISIAGVAVDVLVVQELHATEAEVGIIRAVQFLPYLLVGLLAGALVDRWPRHTTLVGTHICSGLTLLLIPILWLTGQLNLPVLATLLFGVGVFGVFTAAVEQSYIPDLVPRESLVTANARVGQSMTVTQTSGPALAGVLVGWLTAPFTLLITAVTHLVASATVATIRVPEQRPDHPEKLRVFRSISEGVRFIYRQRTLAPLGISTHVWFLANSAAVTAFALFALRELGLSPFIYGIVLACAGVGGLIGAFCAPPLTRLIGDGWVVVVSNLIAPLAWAGLMLIPHAEPWAVVCLALAKTLYGFGLALSDPAELSYRQTVTPRNMLGRVNATMRSANRTMAMMGALAGGVLAGLIGYRGTIGMAIAVFILALVIVAASPMRTARSG